MPDINTKKKNKLNIVTQQLQPFALKTAAVITVLFRSESKEQSRL